MTQHWEIRSTEEFETLVRRHQFQPSDSVVLRGDAAPIVIRSAAHPRPHRFTVRSGKVIASNRGIYRVGQAELVATMVDKVEAMEGATVTAEGTDVEAMGTCRLTLTRCYGLLHDRAVAEIFDPIVADRRTDVPLIRADGNVQLTARGCARLQVAEYVEVEAYDAVVVSSGDHSFLGTVRLHDRATADFSSVVGGRFTVHADGESVVRISISGGAASVSARGHAQVEHQGGELQLTLQEHAHARIVRTGATVYAYEDSCVLDARGQAVVVLRDRATCMRAENDVRLRDERVQRPSGPPVAAVAPALAAPVARARR
jgi:hypothetical protein